MALQLNKDLKNGFAATYAVVTRISIDFVNKTSILNLSFYKDLLSFQNGLSPVAIETKEFNSENFIFSADVIKTSSPLDVAYAALSSDPDLGPVSVVADAVAVAVPK